MYDTTRRSVRVKSPKHSGSAQLDSGWPFHGDETTGRALDVYIGQIEISGHRIRGSAERASPGSRSRRARKSHESEPLLGAR